MGKIGVAIGEEFPVDEGKPRSDGDPGPEGCSSEDERERWRRHHEEWHRRWREYAGGSGRRWFFGGPDLLRVLIITGGIAMLIAIFTHFFYFILGAAVLAGLVFVDRSHHHDALWDMHPRASDAE